MNLRPYESVLSEDDIYRLCVQMKGSFQQPIRGMTSRSIEVSLAARTLGYSLPSRSG